MSEARRALWPTSAFFFILKKSQNVKNMIDIDVIEWKCD